MGDELKNLELVDLKDRSKSASATSAAVGFSSRLRDSTISPIWGLNSCSGCCMREKERDAGYYHLLVLTYNNVTHVVFCNT